VAIYAGNGSGLVTLACERGDMMSGPMPLAARNRAVEARRGDEEHTSQKLGRVRASSPGCLGSSGADTRGLADDPNTRGYDGHVLSTVRSALAHGWLSTARESYKNRL
jgi:hypothetical protein